MTHPAIVRGDDYTDDLALGLATTTPDGEPVPIIGATLWWQLRRQLGDPDEAALIRKSTADGVTIIDAPGGLFTVELESADTADLAAGLCYWEAQSKITGRIRTLGSGRLRIKPDQIRATSL